MKKLKITRASSFIESVRGILIFGTALVVLFKGLYKEWPALTMLSDIGAMLIIAVCMFFLDRKGQILSGALLVVGIILLVMKKAPLDVWLSGFGQNIGFAAIMVFVPLLTLPISNEKYMRSIQQFKLRHINRGDLLYLFNTFLSFFLGMVLNLGGPPVAYALIQDENHNSPAVRRLSIVAIVRGFASGLFLSPNFVATGLVATGLGLKWSETAIAGSIMAVTLILFGYFIELRKAKQILTADNKSSSDYDQKKLIELALFILCSLLTVVVIQEITGGDILTVVPLVSIGFTALWLSYLYKGYRYWGSVAKFLKTKVAGIKNELTIFITAGFLSVALENSGFSSYVPAFIKSAGHNDIFLMSFIIILSITITGVIGIHPFATVTVLVSILDPDSFGVTPIFMYVTLLGGWTLSTIMSPFSGLNLIVSSIGGEQSTTVALKWNSFYVLLSLILVLVVINVLRIMGII